MRAVIPFLTLAIFVACSSEDKISDNHNDEESIVTFTQFSAIVKDTFFINVQLPEGYSENPDKSLPCRFFAGRKFLLSNDGFNV